MPLYFAIISKISYYEPQFTGLLGTVVSEA
jgi:hypothetical protein